MQAYQGRGGIAPLIHNLMKMKVSGQLHALAAPTPGMSPWDWLNMRLGTSQKRMTFRGLCIVLYSYNKTNEMH